MSDNYQNKSSSSVPNSDHREILDRINNGIRRYYEYNQPNLNRMRSEREFLFITQWMQSEIAGFQQLNKPIFTYNKLYDYYKKLIGEQRYNTSTIEVRSKNINNENITQKEVDLRADIIRGIEYKSRADLAYQNAFGNAVSGGLGFIRLRTDYLSPNSFEQEIYIDQELYAERVFYDPNCISKTKTDGNYMGRYDQMDRKLFEETYPGVPWPKSFPSNFNLEFFTWGDKDTVTICEYYEKQWYNFTLYKLTDGRTVTKKEFNRLKKEYEKGLQPSQPDDDNAVIEKNNYQQAMDAQMSQMIPLQMPMPNMPQDGMQPPMPQQPQPPGLPQQGGAQISPLSAPSPFSAPTLMAGAPMPPEIAVDENGNQIKRKSRDYKIICYKCIYDKILEEYEWPGKEFPFAAVMGGEEYIRGRSVTMSMTTYARDPQRFFNFIISDLAQAAKNNRREQFLVTPDNIAGFENFWSQPGNVLGGLLYNPDGTTQKEPIRLPTPELSQSLLQNLQQADRDMRSIIGYPQEDPSGKMFNQLNGKAMRELQRIGNSSNAIYFDNLKSAQEQIGRAILSMMPIVYDTERSLLAYGVDGKAKQVTVNRQVAGKVDNDLSRGDFDITVTAGANYAVQREEALQVLLQLIQAIPNSGTAVADIIAKNVDIEDNVELVNRFKALVPPQIIAQSEGKPMPPQQPDPQQQMAQQLAQAKLKIEAAKVQTAQEEARAQQQLNKVKMSQAMVDMESSKIRAYGELQKAGLDYRAQMAQAEAKIASAHADIHEKHFEAIKHIHNLTEQPLRPKEEGEE